MKPGPLPLEPSERFWSKVLYRPGSCWGWRGSHTPRGYARFSIDGTNMDYAHRFAYEAEHGPIPDGYQIDHLCRTRGCVNPQHLEIVSPAENTRRGICSNARKTLCPKGHPYDRVWGKHRGRYCSQCDREKYLKRRYLGKVPA